jgi:DNA-binding response OmpR family regulator
MKQTIRVVDDTIENTDIIKALKMGAADDIAKPFYPAELQERAPNALALVATASMQSHVAQFAVSAPGPRYHISALPAYLHDTDLENRAIRLNHRMMVDAVNTMQKKGTTPKMMLPPFITPLKTLSIIQSIVLLNHSRAVH